MSKKELVSTEPYKGVRDFYPEDQAFMQYLMATFRDIVQHFGYVEYNASVLEPAELYRSKSSEEIVKEQTYTFIDRGDREVTLRPEMTPTVARMVAAKRRELGFPLRLFSMPNVFRYERPQRGRLREHWQFNADLFGSHSPASDAEIISVASELMRAFGATDQDFIIKINSRVFLNSLIKEFELSDNDAKRFIGLLDRRAKMPHEDFTEELGALGVPLTRLSPDNVPDDVAEILEALANLGITNALFDPSVVRGFTYYTGMVFEVFDTHPDNTRSLFGGGRFDNLLANFSDEEVPAVGFGMGDVTMHDFLAVRGLLPAYMPPTHVYVAVTGPDITPYANAFAQELRTQGVAVEVDFGERKLTDQIKTAAKHQVPHLIVIGQDELASQTVVVRNLETGSETKLDRTELAAFFLNL